MVDKTIEIYVNKRFHLKFRHNNPDFKLNFQPIEEIGKFQKIIYWSKKKCLNFKSPNNFKLLNELKTAIPKCCVDVTWPLKDYEIKQMRFKNVSQQNQKPSVNI